MQKPSATAGAGAPTGPVNISPGHLLRLARAFSCVFWGMPLGVLLFLNALRLPFWSYIPLPPYVIGIALLYFGAILMYTVGKLTPRWPGKVRRMLGVLFLQVYFAPFVYWWQRQPTVSYHMVNLLGLVLCSLLILLLTDQLAEELARALRDPVFRAEAAVSGWAVVLLIVPFAATAAYALAAAARHGADLYSVLLYLGRMVPAWAGFLLVLPFTMTMACAWKAKESCLRLLKTSCGQGAPESFEQA